MGEESVQELDNEEIDALLDGDASEEEVDEVDTFGEVEDDEEVDEDDEDDEDVYNDVDEF